MKFQQRGFTLLELLITLLLSSVVIAAVSQVFLQSKRSFTKQQNLSFMVEDGRYAIEILNQEFRRVGFLVNPMRVDVGYTRPDIFPAADNVLGSGLAFLPGEHIKGAYNAGGFFVPNDLNHVIFRYQLNPAGTCSIDLYRVKAECLRNGAVWTENANDVDNGNTPCSIMVDDDYSPPLVPPRSADIKVFSLYVADLGDGPTLFCRAESLEKDIASPAVNNNGGNAIPLVSNVEAMHIFYGEDTDGDGSANRYLTADQVPAWPNVVSIRFHLVLRSADRNMAVSDTSTYPIEGATFNVTGAGDKRLYRVFTTTVAFRN